MTNQKQDEEWEYNLWELEDFESKDIKAELPEFDFQSKFENMGENCWEFVTTIDTVEGRFLVFKRPKRPKGYYRDKYD